MSEFSHHFLCINQCSGESVSSLRAHHGAPCRDRTNNLLSPKLYHESTAHPSFTEQVYMYTVFQIVIHFIPYSNVKLHVFVRIILFLVHIGFLKYSSIFVSIYLTTKPVKREFMSTASDKFPSL